jgi:ERCC4-type nuclease
MLHVDSRERALTAQAVHRAVCGQNHKVAECPTVKVHKLESGDFAIIDKCGHALGVSRKKEGDLLGSLSKTQKNGNKHFHDELERMARDYTARILLVEGPIGMDPVTRMTWSGPNHRLSQWRYCAVWMMVWSACTTYRTDLLPTSDLQATCEILRVLHERATHGCVLPAALRAEEFHEEIAA